MRKLAIAAAFLALLLTECGAEAPSAEAPTKSAQPQETTADTITGSTQPETTAETAAIPEKAAPPEKTAPPEKAAPPITVAPAGWVSAIGDSVMLGDVDALLQKTPNLALIDAQGSRQPPAAIDVLRRRGAAGQLGDSVILHVGNNGPFTAEHFDEMMQVLAGVRKVLIVNVTVPPGVKNPIAVPNNDMLADRVRRYQNTVLVDWHAASAGHPEFFGEDGTHLTLQRAQSYADLIAAYLEGPEEGSVALPGP